MQLSAIRYLSFSLLLLLVACSQQTDPDAEKTIRHVLLDTWHSPENPLTISPVSIAQHHALAGWTQGEKGGVALLEQDKDGNWSVSVCGTTELAAADILGSAGMSDSQAKKLSLEFLALLESEPADRQAQFDSFGEAVHIGAHHQHH